MLLSRAQHKGHIDLHKLAEKLTHAVPPKGPSGFGPGDDKVGQMKAERLAREEADDGKRQERIAATAAAVEAARPQFVKEMEEEARARAYMEGLEKEERKLHALVLATTKDRLDPKAGALMSHAEAAQRLRVVRDQLVESQTMSISRDAVVKSIEKSSRQ